MLLLFLQASTLQLFSVRDVQMIAPEVILTVFACGALVMEVILPYKQSKWTAYFALAGIALALVSLLMLFHNASGTFVPWRVSGPLPELYGFYGTVRLTVSRFSSKRSS